MKRIFTVNGQPFFPLGGQSRNSSGYNELEFDTAFRAVKAIHGNTLEIPVYWEQIEPQEGQFDFSSVDALVGRARREDLHLVLLWFGTWKNGDMDYAPGWVKTHPERFQRVVSPSGRELWVLSSHCEANLEADRQAFVQLCAHLKAIDRAIGTVIALQIENEPGIMGSDRDYRPTVEAFFTLAVPEDLIDHVAAARRGWIWEQWEAAGARKAGTWPELFGSAAGEILTAWSIATYIDRIAEAGKAIYPLPMYVNVWLEENGWSIPGESYPAGGAVTRVLDLYRWYTPHLDLIAPDIYLGDARGYEAVCAWYGWEENPLFIPESMPGGTNPWQMWKALAKFNTIGYAFFAVEYVFAVDGTLRPELRPLVKSFQAAAAAIPLFLKYQGTPHLQAVVEEESLEAQRLPFEGWMALAAWGNEGSALGGRDWRHLDETIQPGERGCGMVVQVGPDEFFLAGNAFRLILRPQEEPAHAQDAVISREFFQSRQAHFLSVEEGHFDPAGAFVVDRRRNGDEVDFGLWVSPDCGVIRVRMMK